MTPELWIKHVPPKKEGAGKAGCPPHPRPPVRKKCTGVETTGVGATSGLPCAMVLTASFVLSPATSSFLPPSPRGLKGFARPVGPTKPPRDLTPATGARTTRLLRPQQRRSSCAPFDRSRVAPPCDPLRAQRSRVHRIPYPTSVTTRTPLLSGRDSEEEAIDLGGRGSGFFLCAGLDRANQVELVQQIAVCAHAIFQTMRRSRETTFIRICPSGDSNAA
jgi:hypothetical protein